MIYKASYFHKYSALRCIYLLFVYLTHLKNVKLCVSYVLGRPRHKFYSTNKTPYFVLTQNDSGHTVHICFNHLSVTLQTCLSESQEDNTSINLCMKIIQNKLKPLSQPISGIHDYMQGSYRAKISACFSELASICTIANKQHAKPVDRSILRGIGSTKASSTFPFNL